jgi:uncharacterized membrane protein
MAHARWLARMFSDEDLAAISARVAAAESRTSAEIRVHIERHVPRSLLGRRHHPLHRARHVFRHLGMHRTHHRAAVLLYLALDDRVLAIFGDEAVHARVGDEYWTTIRDAMVARMRSGASREALTTAVDEVGRVLAEHFPRGPDDPDDLENTVSVDE